MHLSPGVKRNIVIFSEGVDDDEGRKLGGAIDRRAVHHVGVFLTLLDLQDACWMIIRKWFTNIVETVELALGLSRLLDVAVDVIRSLQVWSGPSGDDDKLLLEFKKAKASVPDKESVEIVTVHRHVELMGNVVKCYAEEVSIW